MRKIVLDENGEPIDELKNRNAAIIARLQQICDEFILEDKKDIKGKKRYGFRMLQYIEDELNERCPLMTESQFEELEVEDIEYYWKRFHNLITHYNRYFEIVPNRQMFMAYLGVNSRMFALLKKGGNNDDEVLSDMMLFIDDKLTGKGFSAGENGNADPKALSKRLSASGMAGHGVISATDNKLLGDDEEVSSAAVMLRQAADISAIVSAVVGKLPAGNKKL